MSQELAVNSSGAEAPVTRKHIEGFGSVYLRGQTWWLELWHDGRQLRESSGSRRERDAIQRLKQRHQDLARDEYVEPKAGRITIAELLDRVEREYPLVGNRSLATLKFRNAPLRVAFGNVRATRLTPNMIEQYAEARLREGRAKATVNRELAALRRAFNRAAGKKELPRTVVPTIKLYPEDNVRKGFVEIADFTALVSHLPSPLDDVAWFAYRSGWRKREVLTLTWADVDMAQGVAWLRAEFSKNKEPRELPLTPALRQIIERRWQARLVDTSTGPKVCDLVFHRNGQPVRDFRGAWETACEAIGKPDLLFHDLRRSAVRNMLKAGVRETVAMELSGHKTNSIFRRYAITGSADRRAAMELTEASLSLEPHNSAIFPHTPRNGHEVNS